MLKVATLNMTKPENTNLASFQQYQLAFCAHLRSPKMQPKPNKVAAKRMAMYTEIVFNNLLESVSACFPVAQSVLGKRAWQRLVKAFFSEHAASSPIFREIPEEFLQFLTTQTELPPYLSSLCHYEWVELLVASMPDQHGIEASDADLLHASPVFNPTLQLLNYDYAVHTISAKRKPKQAISTQLLVYRNSADAVKFIELNPLTFRLLQLLQQADISCLQALTILANELAQTNPDATIQFGLEILQQLQTQEVILGAKPDSL